MTDTTTLAKMVDGLWPLATPIENLVLDPENARRGDVEAIRRSLNVFGQRKPVVVRQTGEDATGRPTGIVIAGNHTMRAAVELGWNTIAAVFVADDVTTAKAYALADNRTGELAEWDGEQLAATLRELNDDAFDMESLGWNDDDLARLLDSGAASVDGTEHDDEPDAPAEPTVYSNDDVIDAAFAHFREAGFPYPAVPRYLAMQEINALAALDTGKLQGSTVAYRVADPYQQHRYSVRCHQAKGQVRLSPVGAYERDDLLRRACAWALDERKLTDRSLLSALALVQGTQCAAQFRPAFALLMYRRFAPAGGTVLDTSTGFGGRLLGFMASNLDAYIGIDPNTVTCAGNQAMVDDLCTPGKTVELICQPAEDVAHELVAGRADFAFTSPPYFAKELYSDEATQSCVRYKTGDEWRAGFLRPMLALQFAALKPGAYSCVNIADVHVGNTFYPLCDWTIEDAQRAGLEHVRTEQFPLPRVPGEGDRPDAFEPVIVLRKPEKAS